VERGVLTRYQYDIHNNDDNYSREIIRLLFENGIKIDFREIEKGNDMNHDISYEMKYFLHILGRSWSLIRIHDLYRKPSSDTTSPG
jgi:hypothetical protein